MRPGAQTEGDGRFLLLDGAVEITNVPVNLDE